jgi:uncharacterized protein YbjQ (UPF0145 family)
MEIPRKPKARDIAEQQLEELRRIRAEARELAGIQIALLARLVAHREGTAVAAVLREAEALGADVGVRLEASFDDDED